MKLTATSAVLADQRDKANVSTETSLPSCLEMGSTGREKLAVILPLLGVLPLEASGTRMFLPFQELRSSLFGAHLN